MTISELPAATSRADRREQPKSVLLIGAFDQDHPWLFKLDRSYRDRGCTVRFDGLDRTGTRPRSVVVNGLPCNYILSGWGYSNWRLLFGIPLWSLTVLRRTLMARADLVQAFELETALPVSLALWWRRVPFIYNTQDNYELRRPWPFGLRHLIRLAEEWVCSRAAIIVVPDEIRIVGAFARNRKKVVVIPNCPEDIAPVEVQREPPSNLTVLAMGHLAERRGVDLLLEAIKQVPGARLIMAGRFHNDWLEEKARAMPQVEFHEWVPWEEAMALTEQADVVYAFYDPQYSINLLANSEKWFDAMMMRRPVLTNSEVVRAEWIRREDFGYLCQYGDVTALASVLKQIQQEPEEARRKGLRGRALFERGLNWKRLEATLWDATTRVFARRSKRGVHGYQSARSGS